MGASVLERSWLAVLGHGLLLLNHVGRHLAITHGGEWHGLGAHVLVGVEAAKCHNIRQTRNLDDRSLVLHRLVLHGEVLGSALVVSLLEEAGLLLCLVVLEFLWHGRKSHSVRQVGQGVDELSPLGFTVEERAALSELALSSLVEVLAGLGLVVRVNGSEGGLAKVLWKWLYLSG